MGKGFRQKVQTSDYPHADNLATEMRLFLSLEMTEDQIWQEIHRIYIILHSRSEKELGHKTGMTQRRDENKAVFCSHSIESCSWFKGYNLIRCRQSFL